MFDIDAALMTVIETEGSDLHLKVPAPPIIRRYGKLVSIPDVEPLSPDDTERTLFHMLTDENKLESFRAEREVDFSYSIPRARFRVNASFSAALSSMSVAPSIQIKTARTHAARVIDEIAEESAAVRQLARRLGQSTTLAAMTTISTQKREAIGTIEDTLSSSPRQASSSTSASGRGHRPSALALAGAAP